MDLHNATSTIAPRQVDIEEPLPRPEPPRLQILDATHGRGLTSLPPSLNEHDDEVELHEDTTSTIQPDIEHVYVEDDPRKWSARRKNLNLALVAVAAFAPASAAFIYNPAFNDIKRDFNATDHDISLSLSIFIFVQGASPIFWSAVSEIYGRKYIYLASLSLYAVGNIVAALSKNIGVLIGMRLLQAAGGSATLTIGSGVIADMFDSHERGTRIGIFFAMPLLGPSLGPMVGGALVQAFNWRATFWFLSIFGGLSLLSFTFFKETFRKERSAAYQGAVKRAREQAEHKAAKSAATSKAASRVGSMKRGVGGDVLKHELDLEGGLKEFDPEKIKLSLADVNPIRPSWIILKQRTNVVILATSGLLFGFSYGICYTAARTFARAPYSYDPLRIGAILLAYGGGNILGSIFGGRVSDHVLAKLRAAKPGESQPEMRLQSTKFGMAALPLPILVYGWMCQKGVHVSGPIVMLFIAGASVNWTYSSTLAYVVDSNVGRASSAIAMNSMYRGISGLIVAEVAGPLQDSIGDGGLYSIWTGIVFFVIAAMMLVIKKGPQWRQQEETKRATKRAKQLAEEQVHAKESTP